MTNSKNLSAYRGPPTLEELHRWYSADMITNNASERCRARAEEVQPARGIRSATLQQRQAHTVGIGFSRGENTRIAVQPMRTRRIVIARKGSRGSRRR